MFLRNKRQRDIERESATRNILMGYQFAKEGGFIYIPDKKVLTEAEEIRIRYQGREDGD